jgi:hypothetical protein
MFANIRAQRAQLRAMRGMDPDQKQVYGLVYDYLSNNRSFAKDSTAMQIASKMAPKDAAELLQVARDSAKPGVASVDDIVQAYIQMRQSAQQGQQSIGAAAAQQAELETGDALAASTAEEIALAQSLQTQQNFLDSQRIVSGTFKPMAEEKPQE